MVSNNNRTITTSEQAHIPAQYESKQVGFRYGFRKFFMNEESSLRKGRVVLSVLLVTVLITSAVLAINRAEAAATTYILEGAGDIASCSNSNDEATAKLLDNISGTVFTLGDNAYTSGSSSQYTNCYGPTWGGINPG